MENLNSFIGKNVMAMDKFLKQSQSRSIKVKHMSDTSDLKPKNFDTWKEFWEDAKKGEMTFPNIEDKCVDFKCSDAVIKKE